MQIELTSLYSRYSIQSIEHSSITIQPISQKLPMQRKVPQIWKYTMLLQKAEQSSLGRLINYSSPFHWKSLLRICRGKKKVTRWCYLKNIFPGSSDILHTITIATYSPFITSAVSSIHISSLETLVFKKNYLINNILQQSISWLISYKVVSLVCTYR